MKKDEHHKAIARFYLYIIAAVTLIGFIVVKLFHR